MQHHACRALQALKGAMKDPSQAIDPTQTMEYQKLFTLASKHAEVQNVAGHLLSIPQPLFSFMVALWQRQACIFMWPLNWVSRMHDAC